MFKSLLWLGGMANGALANRAGKALMFDSLHVIYGGHIWANGMWASVASGAVYFYPNRGCIFSRVGPDSYEIAMRSVLFFLGMMQLGMEEDSTMPWLKPSDASH